MHYTLGQAAKATGKTKGTIANAIKKGRLSAGKDDIGQYQIDPAELHRIYPPSTSSNGEGIRYAGSVGSPERVPAAKSMAVASSFRPWSAPYRFCGARLPSSRFRRQCLQGVHIGFLSCAGSNDCLARHLRLHSFMTSTIQTPINKLLRSFPKWRVE